MNKKDKVFLGFSVPILLIAGFFTYFAMTNLDVKGEAEWSNNATLIAEVGVGIVVTLVVLMITKLSEIKIDKKISSIQSIVNGNKVTKLLTAIESKEYVIRNLEQIQFQLWHRDIQVENKHIFNPGLLNAFLKQLIDDNYVNLEFFTKDELYEINQLYDIASLIGESTQEHNFEEMARKFIEAQESRLKIIRKEIRELITSENDNVDHPVE